MKNKYLLSFIIAFASVALFAQNTVWKLEKTLAAESNWAVDTNWTNGVPEEVTKTVFNVSTAADCIVDDTDSAHVKQLVMGDNKASSLLKISDGGVLTTHGDGDWSAVGYNASAEMIIEAGGIVNAGHRFHVGLVVPVAPSEAILEVAGTLNVLVNKLTINDPGDADWTAEVYLTAGGVINTPNLYIGAGGLLDVTGGTLIVGRDMKDDLIAYVNEGQLTAEGGSEEPTIEWQITGEGETADTATVVTSSTTVGVFNNKVADRATLGVYPNPATDVVYFRDNVVANVSIYSITGQIVLSETNVSSVNVSGLKPGYYVVKAEADRKIYMDKLIIE